MSRSFTVIVFASFILAFLASCGGGGQAQLPATPMDDGPALQVATATVADERRPAHRRVVATVASRQEVTVQAMLSGTILALPVRLGDRVTADATVARIESQALRSQLAQAQAEAERAATELQRFEQLLERGAVTQQEYDRVLAQARVAANQVAVAEAQLAYAIVRAPFDGVVTQRLAEAGEVAMPGRALLRLADPDQLEIRADLPESAVQGLTVGATIGLYDDGSIGEATIREISPTADPRSRTVHVVADPAAAVADGLRLGRFLRLQIPVGEEQLRSVPMAALTRRGQLDVVFVVADEIARMRVVQPGRRLGDRQEILAGLAAGERVVLDPPMAMRHGRRVTISDTTAPTTDESTTDSSVQEGDDER